MRAPDRIIGQDYLHRWYLIPRNRFLNIYLHKFMRSDDDRATHDHPWWSLSFLLKGKLREVIALGNWVPMGSGGGILAIEERRIRRFLPVFRRATHQHRIVLEQGPAWTLFITGPKVRPWGFLCPKGWVHWRQFCDESGNKIGGGCE